MSGSHNGDGTLVRLDGGRQGPAHARAAVVAHLRDVVAGTRMDELLLLTSEVVANAVVHGGADDGRAIELRLERSDGMLRILVADPGGGRMPEVQSRDDLEPGGLGLVLLDALSERWGVVRHGDGKEVWFDFSLGDRPQANGGGGASFLDCPECGLRLYTLEAWVTRDHCPRCLAALTRGRAEGPPVRSSRVQVAR